MIDETLKRLNSNEQDAVMDSDHITPIEQSALCSQLSDSLSATNGFNHEEKLQKVAECVEQQARNFSMLFRSVKVDTFNTQQRLQRIENKLDVICIPNVQSNGTALNKNTTGRTMYDFIVECKGWVFASFLFISTLVALSPSLIEVIKQYYSK